ncbi:MAG: signal peptidase II [Steroidobacteraceae bacterium]
MIQEPSFRKLGVVGAPRAGQLRWLWLSLLLLGLDQLTKYLIVANFDLYETRTLLPVLNLSYWRNTGAAFSFLADKAGWQRWLFSALALGASVALVIWLARLKRSANLLAAALAMILSGAIGNLIDRMRLGYVNDFVQVHWGEHYFPAFNVADSAITVGAILLLLDAWLAARHKGG